MHVTDCAGPVTGVAVARDSTLLAAAVDRPYGSGGGEVRVWTTDDWRPLTSLRVAGSVQAVRWAGHVLVAAGDRGVYCLTLKNS